jgi:altered-inheritance-of-mitochondria protein 13
LIESLQSSPEVHTTTSHTTHYQATYKRAHQLTPPQTDSTRAKTQELHVQSRINAELARIRDASAKKLSDLTASLTTNIQPDAVPEQQTARDPHTLAAHLSSPFYQDHSAGRPAAAAPKPDSGRSAKSVQQEVMDLKQKLEARKQLEKPSPELEKARENVQNCLRKNDRRPLDCWEEVELFKAEVGKMEKAFVQRAGR